MNGDRITSGLAQFAGNWRKKKDKRNSGAGRGRGQHKILVNGKCAYCNQGKHSFCTSAGCKCMDGMCKTWKITAQHSK